MEKPQWNICWMKQLLDTALLSGKGWLLSAMGKMQGRTPSRGESRGGIPGPILSVD